MLYLITESCKKVRLYYSFLYIASMMIYNKKEVMYKLLRIKCVILHI